MSTKTYLRKIVTKKSKQRFHQSLHIVRNPDFSNFFEKSRKKKVKVPDKKNKKKHDTTDFGKRDTDRDSLRYTYHGIQRVRHLALGCESN